MHKKERPIKELMGSGTPFEKRVIRYHGKYHSLTEPAVVWANGDYAWFKMDEKHCLSGPAWCAMGHESYWIDGDEYSYRDWLVHPKRIEWLNSQIEKI